MTGEQGSTNTRGQSVLFISNGHGEDLIGARLAQGLRAAAPDVTIRALAVVGLGEAYTSAGIPLIMAGRNMPSGGFVRNSLRNWVMDLRAGLAGLTLAQVRALKRAHDATDLAVCAGDTYLNLLAGYFLRRPIVFLPTAKSDYVDPHWPVEVRLMRRLCVKIFPRDALTAESLAAQGLPAEFAGNVMMDSLDFKGPDLQGAEGEWTIGVLPGSRAEAYENLEDIARVAAAFRDLNAKPARFLVALAGGLSFTETAARLRVLGWSQREPTPDEAGRGVAGHLDYEAGGETVRFTVAKGRFADILAASEAVIGLAGTANEQAVGLGKPVVTFVGRGPQFTEKFVRTQKKLLGEAVAVVEREPAAVARELWRVLTDAGRREAMARVDHERMGEPGGAARIVAEVRRLLSGETLA